MNLISFSLKKPLSILVIVLGLLFFGIKATRDVKVDILPEMNLPVVYIAHSFNGYTPQQMEGYFTKMYVNMMLFAKGIKSIESKNTQGLTLMKITFYEGTEMGEAIASIKALSNRSQVFLPPGAPPPFIIRFDASSQPVGQFVFRSNTKTNNQLQDIANFNARPFLIKIPGLTTAPPSEVAHVPLRSISIPTNYVHIIYPRNRSLKPSAGTTLHPLPEISISGIKII